MAAVETVETNTSPAEVHANEEAQPGEKLPTPSIVYVLSIFGALGGLLFGYDTGIVSGALPLIQNQTAGGIPGADADVTSEIIVSATCVFAFFGSPLGGFCTTKFGRKPTIIASAGIFCVGAGIVALSDAVWVIVVGRSVLGIAIGLASQAVPMYIAESAPPELRGQLTALFNFSCTFGQVIACITAGLLQDVEHGWRWMTGLAAVPALLQLVGMFFLPESPRWLVEKNLSADGLEVLKRLRGSEAAAKLEVDEINEEIKATAAEARNGGGDNKAKRAFQRALVVGCGLQAFQQLCGINTVMYYSSTIFKDAGLTTHDAIWAATLPASCNAAMSFVALILIEKLGRKVLILTSMGLVIVGLIALSTAFYLNSAGGAIMATMSLYICSFGIGLSPVPWTVNSEIYSLSYRALGTSLSTMTNWGFNFIISLTFLNLAKALSPPYTDPKCDPNCDPNPAGAFILYAVFAACGFVFVYFLLPETKGLSLEEIQQLFQGRSEQAGSFIE